MRSSEEVPQVGKEVPLTRQPSCQQEAQEPSWSLFLFLLGFYCVFGTHKGVPPTKALAPSCLWG